MGESAANDTANQRGFTISANDGTLLNNTDYTWAIYEDTDGDTSTADIYDPVYNGDLTISGSGDFSYNNVISGSINLVKSGSGTLTLSRSNTYTGTTTISGGQINILADAGLGAAPGSFVANQLIFNGGTLFNYNGASINFDANRGVTLTGNGTFKVNNSSTITVPGAITGSGALTVDVGTSGTLVLSGTNTYTGDTNINSGATLRVSGTLADTTDVVNSGTYDVNASDTIQSLSGTGAVDIASSVTLTTGDGDDDTISGVISGEGNLTKVGSGTLTLTGDNTFTGTLTVTVGTVILDDADGDTGTVLSDSASVTVNGGTVTVSDTSETVSSVTQSSGTINGLLISSSGYSYAPAEGVTLTISEVLSGSGGLTMSGAGTLVLTATNTFTGNITISAGTLKIDGTGTLESGIYDGTISNAGTLHYSSTTNQILGGVISSTGALTKDETSTLTLSAANTYTGATTINAGTLDVDGTLAQTAVDVASGATYDVDATDTVLSIEGEGTIDLTDAALTAGDGNDQTFSGVFNGANDFTKVGSGTLTLSGDNATASYTGRVIIDDGVVSVAADSNLGDPDTLDADRLILKGGTLSASSNFTLDTNRGITLSMVVEQLMLSVEEP
jgi:autotransporter-associated beta strand protein